MINRFIITISFSLAVFQAISQIPNGYYDNVEGLTGDELKMGLHEIINDHVEFSYNDLRDFILKETDEDPENSDNVILLYTGRSQAKNTFGGNPNDWNREHVWAKSHGGFGNNPPAGTDAHHIRPTDVSVNGIRGNLDFDTGGNPIPEAPGCYVDNDSFEPRDAVKGDVARMIFYMAVRYKGGSGEPNLEVVDAVNTSPQPEHGKLSQLILWNSQDPPDDFEINRNDIIYYNYQNNRNPFIDHPEFVDMIWGNSSDISLNYRESIYVYPNPAINSVTFTKTGSKVSDYQVYSASGHLVLKGKTNNQNIIYIGSLAEGIYQLIIICKDNCYSTKFVKITER